MKTSRQYPISVHLSKFTRINGIAFFATLLLSLLSTPLAQATQPYLVGRGMSDITGPAIDLQLWGFGRPDQIGEGIHIRQRARAFIIAQTDQPHSRLVFVSADLGSIDHHMTLEVIEQLQAHLGGNDIPYDLHNVILSATHTHSGPGGYWQSRSDTGLDGGLYPEHFSAIVAGITDAILKAHNDLQPGNILINSGQVENAGANRSLVAYEQNPAAERQRYSSNTNTSMTLLKFTDDSGDIGMLNWYALHPTAMNYYNRLISGDHKGYASLSMERDRGTTYHSADDFVAAFAQADPGDVTPNTNLNNTGPGDTDVQTTQIMGDRQRVVAEQLFASAEEALQGPIYSRQIYVDLSDYEVADKFTGSGVQRTCPSAYGYSFAGGSTEDGGGHFLFREGMTRQQWWRDLLIGAVTGVPKWTEAVRDCQHPKPILFETGSQNPPLQPQVHPVSIARIGQLVILAIPGEVTTMAGRRLRNTVMAELDGWASHIVLAGYANDFAGYITTPEEYQLQQYEAAHNLHGQWSLPAYQQVASILANALQSRTPITDTARHNDWRGKPLALSLPTGDAAQASKGERPGTAMELKKTQFEPGETLITEFWSTHPAAHYRPRQQFLVVERKTGESQQIIADDGDWATRVSWQTRKGGYIARLEWDIPSDVAPGQYRLVHLGLDAQGKPFNGESAWIDIGSSPH